MSSSFRDSGYYPASALVQYGVAKVANEMYAWLCDEGTNNVSGVGVGVGVNLDLWIRSLSVCPFQHPFLDF